MDKKQAKPVVIHGVQYWKVGEKLYVKIRNSLAEISHFNENGTPVLMTWSEETPNANGGQDCTVHVECLQIAAKPHKPG